MVCTLMNYFPDGTEFVGVGIEPDIHVKFSIQDLYDNKDRFLECTINEFNKSLKNKACRIHKK